MALGALRRRISANPQRWGAAALTLVPCLMLAGTTGLPLGATGVRQFVSPDQLQLGADLSGGTGIRPLRAGFVSDALAGFGGGDPNAAAGSGIETLARRSTPTGEIALPDSGPLALTRATAIRPLINDRFSDAYTITGEPFTGRTSTIGATRDLQEPGACGGNAGSVWFRFTAPDTHPVVLSAYGSDYATNIAVFTGTSEAQLRTVGTCNGRFVVLTPTAAGTTYSIQVTGAGGDLVFHLVRDTSHGTITLESRKGSGSQVIFGADVPAPSADGRYVAFVTADQDMAETDPTANPRSLAFCSQPGHDMDGPFHIAVRPCYVGIWQRDRSTGAVTPISGGYSMHMSEDANTIAMQNVIDGVEEVDMWNRATSITRITLRPDGGKANGGSRFPVISGNGRYVGFSSAATDIVPRQRQSENVFVYDQVTKTIKVLVNEAGHEPERNVYPMCLSADGRYAVVSTGAALVPEDTNGEWDTYRVDLHTNKAVRVSVSSSGAEVPDNGVHAYRFLSGQCISDDGRYVIFNSMSGALVPNDTNGLEDIFVHDIATGSTERVSVGSNGEQANNVPSTHRTETPVGSACTHVVIEGISPWVVPPPLGGLGNYFVPEPTVNCSPTWHDVDFGYAISHDGRYVAFVSQATNFYSQDTNGAPDIYRHDRLTGQTTCVSVNPKTGAVGLEDSWGHPRFTGNADGITFQSRASNLVDSDLNDDVDAFFWHEENAS
jgi:Tol biopolymer transport system component